MSWFNENPELFIPIIVIASGAFGYLTRRHITGQKHIEDSESIERTIKLKQLLQSEGMSLAEAKALREAYRQEKGGIEQVEARAVVAKEAEASARERKNSSGNFDHEDRASSIAFEHTTAGVKLKVGEDLDRLNGELRYLLAEFAHECSEARAHSLYETQDAWEAFRAAEADFAGLLWEGGTGAPLLGLARMVELTEQRIRDIRLAREEAKL